MPRYGNDNRLTSLPHSAQEVGWVFDAFQKEGIGAGRLLGENATENNVRHAVSGRRVIHFACHGLVDQEFGNFFGALALTPGKATASIDDGFLTLPEICELDLMGCELSVLSACQTNFGPQFQGEGAWSLSCAFFIAGSRRVVASNWLVDDEAASNLVAIFCDRLAVSEKTGKIDHAECLLAAKRSIRGRKRWQAPYYWASFVLSGPN